MKKHLVLAVCFILLLCLVLTACGAPASDSGEEATEATEAAKDSLVFALSSEPISLDPSKTTDQMCWSIFCSLYDTLFWYNDKTGEVENRLAEDYSWNDDYTELTIKLREGVLFHNGREMKAEDVAYSIDKMASSSFTQVYIVNYESAEAIDDYTVKITYTDPYEGALKSLAVVNYAILPKEEYEADPDGFQLNPIGTGPYKFVSRTTGVEVAFEANEDYWRGAPAIKDLKYRIFTDVNTAVVALEAGEADFLTHAPLTSKQVFMDNPNLAWDETPFYGPLILYFKLSEDSPYSDINLRRAVQCAINRDDVLLGAADGIGIPLYSTILPGMVGYDEEFKSVPYDPDKAIEYLAAAGYTPETAPSIELNTVDTVVYYKACDVVASQLSKVGFKVTVNRIERSAYFAELYTNHNFEVAIAGYGASLPDSEFISGFTDSSQIESGYNFSELNDPKVDELLLAGRREVDPEKRAEYYKELQTYISDNALQVPLIMYGAGVAYNSALKGVEPDCLYRFEVFNYSF